MAEFKNIKLIIAGSRDLYVSTEKLESILIENGIPPSQIREVVSGCASGIDICGEVFAKQHKIPIKQFHPNWRIGKRAGPLRNKQMAQYGDVALVIMREPWTTGSLNMIQSMKVANKPVFVVKF